MPLYEYECDNCGNRFERIQSFRDEPIKQCPNCGLITLHKVFHPAGLVFKGSGWYITDNRKPASTESKPSASSAEKSTADAKPSAESKPKTESKSTTETKTESKKETGDSK